MTEANIEIKELQNGVKSVVVSGQLDESNVDEKIKVVYEMFKQTPQGLKIIFDLENLDYMNSKSIGYLTDIYGKITERGGKMVITKAKENIVDILQVVGLTQLIQSFATNEEAILALNQGATPAPEQQPAPAAPEMTQPPAAQAPVSPESSQETPAEIKVEPAPVTEQPAQQQAEEAPAQPQPQTTNVVASEANVAPAEPIQKAPKEQPPVEENTLKMPTISQPAPGESS
jgi:anti-anti-sigma factor